MVAKSHDARPRSPTLAEIRAAAARLAPYALRTPLLRLEVPGTAGEIYLKLENLQPIGAYKVRSMGNVLLQEDRDRFGGGAYTASSGNAGLALAWVAQQLGIAARVYAPEGSPVGKLAAIRRYGAEVCLLQRDIWWRIIQHRGHPSEPGVYVIAVRDNRALAGNATIGLEIVEQLPDVATILVPFGGGGVACGILPPRCVRSNRRSASSPRNALRQHR
ncbi:MAG: pyridoxal-phosphate dependent enzyme [Xanthomonadales bacterium]|nr:pyridoxal-phosphate dependent enzyme [Xanthomonadales bacterium]